MFWNLVTVQYEKYHLHHILLFIVLLLYSIIGALIFCGLESGHEQVMNEGKNRDDVRRSVAAKKIFIDRVQFLYFQIPNASDFYETKLRIALDQYDTLMGIKPVLNQARKWDIWGGLYYAGTIYTTIEYYSLGYGDLSASTVWGRLFTMVYAVIGIPMVITILNDWGTLMFQAIDGFGDVTPSHRVAVANFLLILIGLSVVSMSVNVIQMQLEIIFARIVKTIDNDFKINLSVSADDNKKTATTSEAGEVEKGPSALRPVEDVIKQYGQSMKGTERLLMRFMSKHQ
uniref:Ion_trans_2 domain-containing protein n=1 Tax=Heterorhabditis bacteriophora TaxID=37862 RepID=A0A1I7XIH3_HETBA